jgi:hypothetical protein
VRVEYAKCQARYERWQEEVYLLVEEMRRTMAYTEHQAAWWRSLAAASHSEDSILAKGLRAYALEHVNFETKYALHCGEEWGPVMREAVASRFGPHLSWLGPISSSLPSRTNIVHVELRGEHGPSLYDYE